MPPLFFALAAASSGTTDSTSERLALLQGSEGWESGRCCTYPQELLLELEGPADIHEVEASAHEDFAPRAIDVHFSKDSCSGDGSILSFVGEPAFEEGGTLRFDKPVAVASRGIVRAQLKCYAACSGQVRLIVHEPMTTGKGNMYGQTGLASLELWGRLVKTSAKASTPNNRSAAVAAGADATMLPGDAGDVARVLTELGIPLEVVPIDATTHMFAEVDEGTRKLLLELHKQKDALALSGDHGGMQSLAAQMESLRELGEELRSLSIERTRLADAGETQMGDVAKLAARMEELEEVRLGVAAFYNTNFWIEQMSKGLPPGQSSAR